MSPGSGQPRPTNDFWDNNARRDLVGPCPIGQVSFTAADDADGADANAGFHFG
jgi:hypothetical protein